MHDDRAQAREHTAQNSLPLRHDARLLSSFSSGDFVPRPLARSLTARALPFSSFLVAALACAIAVAQITAAPEAQASAYRETIAGTTVTFEMVPVPAGTVTVAGKRETVAPFAVGRTEVTWEMYDVFALGLDKPYRPGAPAGADATARPSNPYGAPDYGWGHAGFPVISVTRAAAEAFTKWLSQKTGRVYRLPTEAEWAHLASLAAGATELPANRRDAIAWHRDNAGARTHPVAAKAADRLGLFDLFGNAAEWVTTTDGSLVVRGGSFRDAPNTIGVTSRAVQDETWNERDPQLPKSRWWLSDGPFVGFRLVTVRKP